MFLAWNEIKKNKLRFTLITGVLMLVSYLVLSGLASEAVDNWEATAIVVTEEADKSMPQSSMMLGDVDDIETDDIAVIGDYKKPSPLQR